MFGVHVGAKRESVSGKSSKQNQKRLLYRKYDKNKEENGFIKRNKHINNKPKVYKYLWVDTPLYKTVNTITTGHP